MIRIIAVVVAAFFAFSSVSHAASHTGGKMEDKPMAKDGMKKDGMAKEGTKKKKSKKKASPKKMDEKK